MKKLKFKFLIIFFSVVFFLIIFIYQKNNCYSYRINIALDNVLTKEIDNNVASYIKDSLSQIEQIKEIVIFSRENNANIYCKLNSFVFNKNKIASRVERQLNNALAQVDKNAIVSFDDNFDKKIETFVILSTNLDGYKILKQYCDVALDELLSLNITNKIVPFGDQKITTYIYYNNSTLQKYDINIDDIKNLIENNNIFNSQTIKTNDSNSYNIDSNSAFHSVNDIKDIAVFYKNKSFSTKFKDIFAIEEGIKNPSDYFVNLNDKKAVVFGLSKRSFYPRFLFNYKLNKKIKELDKKYPCYIKVESLKTDSLSKIEIYFKNRTSINNTYKRYKEIDKVLEDKKIKPVLFFIGSDSPKISSREEFFEQEKNKLTILAKKIDIGKIKSVLNSKGIGFIDKTDKKIEIIDENLENLYSKLEQYEDEYENAIPTMTNKTMQVNYHINNYDLNDYYSTKKEIIDTLNTYYGGLDCGYYYDREIRIPIVLQNIDNKERLYFYSKNYKSLIYLGSVATNSIQEDYSIIVRKNNKYLGRIYLKK